MFGLFRKPEWAREDPLLWESVKSLKKQAKAAGKGSAKGLVELVLEPDFNRDFSDKSCPKYTHEDGQWTLTDTLCLVHVDQAKKELVQQIGQATYYALAKDVVHNDWDRFRFQTFNLWPCMDGVGNRTHRNILSVSYLINPDRWAKLRLERKLVDVADKLEAEGLGISIKGNYLYFLRSGFELENDPIQVEGDIAYYEDNPSELVEIYRTGESDRYKSFVKLVAENNKVKPEAEVILTTLPQ